MTDLDATELQRNHVLAALRPADVEEVRPRLRRLELARDSEILAPGAALRDAYFPLRGMLSVVASLPSGHSVEVGTVTRTGVVGVPYFKGATNLPYRVVTQIAGPAVLMPIELFGELTERLPHFRDATARYTRTLMTIMGQSNACNAAHEVSQRLARWLLASRDAAESDELSLTQEYLATMIGAQRPTVTLAAGQFQAAGLIAYRRGKIKILDSAGLEARACECYRVLRDDAERTMGAIVA